MPASFIALQCLLSHLPFVSGSAEGEQVASKPPQEQPAGHAEKPKPAEALPAKAAAPPVGTGRGRGFTLPAWQTQGMPFGLCTFIATLGKIIKPVMLVI